MKDKPVKYTVVGVVNFSLWKAARKAATQQKISVSEFIRRVLIETLTKSGLYTDN
jgi:predicted HicB family RNase H-like nuclease